MINSCNCLWRRIEQIDRRDFIQRIHHLSINSDNVLHSENQPSAIVHHTVDRILSEVDVDE